MLRSRATPIQSRESGYGTAESRERAKDWLGIILAFAAFVAALSLPAASNHFALGGLLH
jgi:hypothetical protein